MLLDSLGALHVEQTLQVADLLLFWLLVPSLPKAGYTLSGLENQGVCPVCTGGPSAPTLRPGTLGANGQGWPLLLL